MRTIVHLSDLHFGRVDDALLEPLISAVERLNPDVVVVSGDLTQRAHTAEFEQAAAFLRRLPGPRVVIPGNHDISLYNVARRFLAPLRRFRRYIEAAPMPTFVDDEIAVVGINSSRAFVLKGGRVDDRQARQVEALFGGLGSGITKILVTHHPLQVEAGAHHHAINAPPVLWSTLARTRVDVLLAGHLHQAGAMLSDVSLASHPHRCLVISAGTATSTRNRGERNTFNCIMVHEPGLTVTTHYWDVVSQQFLAGDAPVFVRGSGGWVATDQ